MECRGVENESSSRESVSFLLKTCNHCLGDGDSPPQVSRGQTIARVCLDIRWEWRIRTSLLLSATRSRCDYLLLYKSSKTAECLLSMIPPLPKLLQNEQTIAMGRREFERLGFIRRNN